MHPLLCALLDIVHEQLMRAREKPVDWLLKPGIKAAVAISLLTTAAHLAQERAYDRRSLAKLSAGSTSLKAPVTTGTVRR